jgi:hypothetical protein
MRNSIAIQRFANPRKMQIWRQYTEFSLRCCLRLLSARLPSPREAEVVEAGAAAAVQVPPVAVLLVPVALGWCDQ